MDQFNGGGSREIVEADILLTHFHLDHLLGLMSFQPLFRKGSRVTVHAPVLQGNDPKGVLERLLGEPFFPLSPSEAGASFSVQAIRPGDSLQIQGVSIETCLLSHPGGACGYRLEHEKRSLVVAFDHEHGSPAFDASLAALARGVDLILYDATWDERTDYEPHRGWGHSTWQAGLALMDKAGAGRLACVHHAPTSDDGVLAAREAELQALAPGSVFARQDQALFLR